MPTQRAKVERLLGLLGGCRNGEFAIGQRTATHQADAVSTPFYWYNGDYLESHVKSVAHALGPETALFYSLKANPSLGICQIMAGLGLGAETASLGELLLAREAGFPPSKVIFAGPGKTDEELSAAAEEGIHAVNVESEGELRRLARIALAVGKPVRVGIRVNPAAAVKGAQMRMGSGPQQFGIDEERLAEAVRLGMAERPLEVVGIHVYTGTQLFDLDALVGHLHHVVDMAQGAADVLGRPLEFVNFGGGFGVPYFESTPEFDLEGFTPRYREVVDRCQQDARRLETAQLIVELGRYLVAAAGVYVTRVVDVKQSRGKTFVVTDGGMNHHITATGNFGQVFRKPYPIAVLNRVEAPPMGTVTIAGPCCTPLDIFGQDVALPKVEVGDLIGVFLSGAYGYSASSLAFLSHPTPAEVLAWRGECHVLRERGKREQVLEGQKRLSAKAPALS